MDSRGFPFICAGEGLQSPFWAIWGREGLIMAGRKLEARIQTGMDMNLCG